MKNESAVRQGAVSQQAMMSDQSKEAPLQSRGEMGLFMAQQSTQRQMPGQASSGAQLYGHDRDGQRQQRYSLEGTFIKHTKILLHYDACLTTRSSKFKV